MLIFPGIYDNIFCDSCRQPSPTLENNSTTFFPSSSIWVLIQVRLLITASKKKLITELFIRVLKLHRSYLCRSMACSIRKRKIIQGPFNLWYEGQWKIYPFNKNLLLSYAAALTDKRNISCGFWSLYEFQKIR